MHVDDLENNEPSEITPGSAGDGGGTDPGSTGQEPPAGSPEADKRSQEERDVEAFNAGLEAVKGLDPHAEPPQPPKEKPGDAAGKERPEAAKPGAKPDPSDAGKGQDPKTAKEQSAKRDAEVQKEVDALGLKGKAAERFHEMAGQIKGYADLDRVLKPLNIDNPRVLDAVLVRASEGLDWWDAIEKSTASREQLTSALTVVHAINSGDVRLMNMACDSLVNEVSSLCKRLGRELPGSVDPLADHADLKASVEAMDITRERALELARHRANERVETERQQRVAAANKQRTDQEGAQQAEINQAQADLERLNDELKASDPHFAHRFKTLQENGTFAQIGQMPPRQRAAAVRMAWNLVPDPVNTPVKPRPGYVAPPKGNAPFGNGLKKEQKFSIDGTDAFEAGVLSVTPGGSR